MKPELILREFGKFWVLYTAKAGYGPLMDMFGKDFKTCLSNLNHLHARMGTTMPKLSPPRFEFREIDANKYELDYYSPRTGLGELGFGLIQGLAEKYKVKADIKMEQPEGAKFVRFHIVLG